jgi:O-antigen/teichoic acid export membrane protein
MRSSELAGLTSYKFYTLKKEFLLNILLLVFINLLIKPLFIFGIDLGVQNSLGDQYGLYFALLNLTYLSQIVNDFGLQNFNNRHVSQHPHLMPKYFPNLLAIKALLGVVYVLLTLAIAWGMLGYTSKVLPLLSVLLLNQVLVQFILFLRSNISGLGFYRTDSLLSALDKLLMLLTCGAILWVNVVPLTLMSFALSQTLALAITAVVVFMVLRHKAVFPIRPSWAQNWRAGRPALLFLFRQSLPYALVILLMFAYTRLDAVLLERMSGEAHADVYAGAFRLLEACNMFGYLFASLLLPMFSRQLKQQESVRPLVSLSFKLIWAGSVTLASAIFFAREGLVHWMMPDRASLYRFDVLGVLIWAFVPVSVTYIFGTLLTAKALLMQMNRFFLVGIALDLTLNLFLIPHWQAFGAAVAALATQTFIAAAMIWLSVNAFDFKSSMRGMGQIVGFTSAVLLLHTSIFAIQSWHWGLQFAVSLVAGLVGLLVFRLIDLPKIKQFIR